MSRSLYIVGAGGFGRELYAWAHQSFDMEKEYTFAGFLDDDPRALEGYDYPGGVVDSIDHHQPESDHAYLLGIGVPSIKKQVVERTRHRGFRYLSLLHPSVVLGSNVRLGEGVVLCPGAVVSSDATLGDFVGINFQSTVSHDVVIGDFSQASSYCDFTGGVKVGEGAFLGSHASVLPNVQIGEWATVGAGSVCMRDIPPRCTAFGVPARAMKK